MYWIEPGKGGVVAVRSTCPDALFEGTMGVFERAYAVDVTLFGMTSGLSGPRFGTLDGMEWRDCP